MKKKEDKQKDLESLRQDLEKSKNLFVTGYEKLRVDQDFKWQPRTWYRLKARVDTMPDGSGMIRGKAWKKGDPEPDAWTLEVPHKTAHQSGSPGLFGFSPQDMKVYIDNIAVTPNS